MVLKVKAKEQYQDIGKYAGQFRYVTMPEPYRITFKNWKTKKNLPIICCKQFFLLLCFWASMALKAFDFL